MLPDRRPGTLAPGPLRRSPVQGSPWRPSPQGEPPSGPRPVGVPLPLAPDARASLSDVSIWAGTFGTEGFGAAEVPALLGGPSTVGIQALLGGNHQAPHS